jgi:hypothetical protein
MDKIRFGATVLPVLGAVGGVLRATGSSEQATLVIVVPLLFVAFFGWRSARAIRKAHHAREMSEKAFWELRDVRLQQSLAEQIAAQQEALRQLRLQQQAEQARLLKEHASAEQLTRMMERHRSQYEALLNNRRTA